jgi:NADH dehydrogenase [ubiquinone] 1 alpha subcomplex assembly factor 6
VTPDADDSSAAYCADQVKRFDYDRWLAALFSPTPARRAVYALFTFNIELARTHEQVSNPMLGEIRLQWWRETIDGIYGGFPRAQPIARELAAAVRQHRLTRAHFEHAIDARVQDLYESAPSDIPAAEGYADATAGSLTSLWLEALAVNDQQSIEAARSVAMGWALTGIARAVTFDAQTRRVRLPLDLLHAEGIDAEDVIYDRNPAAVARVIIVMARRAAEHLAKARRNRIVRKALPALLLATVADLYLSRILRAENDERERLIYVSRPRKQLRLLGRALVGRF